MAIAYANGTYPIDFSIPTKNLLGAADAILAAEPGKYEHHETPGDIVAAHLLDVIGGEVETDEEGVHLTHLDMGNSNLGHNIEEGKARLNIIAPYLHPHDPDTNSEPFLVLPWFKTTQRWVARKGLIMVEAVEVQYKVLRTL